MTLVLLSLRPEDGPPEKLALRAVQTLRFRAKDFVAKDNVPRFIIPGYSLALSAGVMRKWECHSVVLNSPEAVIREGIIPTVQ